MKAWREFFTMSAVAVALVQLSSCELAAETIESALAKAYRDNPQLNAQRTLVRATDENVPQALSGYRPRVSVTASLGEEYGKVVEQSAVPIGASAGTTAAQNIVAAQTFASYSYGITATQTLFNGLQTANRTRTAESQVMAAREGLRVLEQTILLNAATIYMDVLRDTGNVTIQKSNVAALRQVLEQTNKRFSKGDVTVTDISQAKTQLAAAELALLQAEYTLSTSRANYEVIIGVPPQNLKPAGPVDRFAPRSLPESIQVGASLNPNITAAMYGVDVAHLQVKIAEGALFPTLSVQASAQQAVNPVVLVASQFTALAAAQLTVPIYQGGGEYALIRQSKETVGQQRLNLDLVRLQNKANVVQAWSAIEAAKGALQKAHDEVAAAETAVNGILKEITVGERTTLDLLITQQNLVNARTALISAQHDRIVSSFSLLAAIGRLSPAVLALPTEIYDPQVHYRQIRDAWIGVRTPTGN
jgi:outer membrane protein